ncbi:acylphosphatase-1 isoform 1-T1 [Macrochelys suwanniensis]
MQPQWSPTGSPPCPRGGGGWRHPPGSLLIVAALFLYQARVMTMAEGDSLISVDYEVFGKVQGVFFRKYTQAEGKKLGVVGWVQNTEDGTVQGQIQGPSVKVRELQEWLRKKGSPKSHIDRAEFRNEKKIVALEYRNFSIVK